MIFSFISPSMLILVFRILRQSSVANSAIQSACIDLPNSFSHTSLSPTSGPYGPDNPDSTSINKTSKSWPAMRCCSVSRRTGYWLTYILGNRACSVWAAKTFAIVPAISIKRERIVGGSCFGSPLIVIGTMFFASSSAGVTTGLSYLKRGVLWQYIFPQIWCGKLYILQVVLHVTSKRGMDYDGYLLHVFLLFAEAMVHCWLH